MARPTFLVAEAEPGAALSTRKLVLETAKFNVITAHSPKEANEFLAKARDLYDAIIVSTDLKGAGEFANHLKKAEPNMPLICVSPNQSTSLKMADHHVPSHEPETLAELCRELFGDPRKTEA
jgi:DNA-binding response OmpR family regulator